MRRTRVFAIAESRGSAAGASALSWNRQFQGPENEQADWLRTIRLLTGAP